jgi:hypothetical protein
MKNNDYTTSFTVDQSRNEVFDAVNQVRGGRSGKIEGATGELGAAFTYLYKDLHFSKQQIAEFVPGKKVVWRVSESNLSFAKSEQTDTNMVYEISQKGGQAEARFSYIALLPQFECHDSCSNTWGMPINGNPRNLITTGKAQPDAFAPDRKTGA